MTNRQRRRRWLAAIVLAIVTGVAPSGQAPEPPIVVIASVDVRDARIGDRLTLMVSLEGPPAIASVRPIIGAAIGAFVVSEVAAQPVRRTRRQWRQSWRLTLTTFEHGRQVIPRISLEGQLADGGHFSAMTPEEIGIDVLPPAATAADELRPVTSVIGLPVSPVAAGLQWLFWLSLLAAGFVATLSAWPRLVRWHRRRDFWCRLIAEANALRRSAETGTARDQYMRAARLLRCGIGRLVDATDSLTTTEMVESIAALGGRGAKVGPALWTVMSHLDEVRFGGIAPDDRMRVRALEEVVAMLRALRAIAPDSGRRRP